MGDVAHNTRILRRMAHVSPWNKATLRTWVLGAASGAALTYFGTQMSERSLDERAAKVHVIRMAGTIGAGDKPINLAAFKDELAKAFKAPNTKAVVIEMNSGGGSPAQSSLLNSHITSMRAKHQLPVLCYCTDVCASGGYYIAAACDEILVLPSTIIGSIGVIAMMPGFVGAMKKLGVEDRTVTSGASKQGDVPWQPSNPLALAKKKVLMTELHEDFIEKVKQGRAGKLDPAAAASIAQSAGDTDPSAGLFDGSAYAGATGVKLGFADGLYADMDEDLRLRFGDDIKIVTKKESTFEMILSRLPGTPANSAETTAAAFVGAVSNEIESAIKGFR